MPTPAAHRTRLLASLALAALVALLGLALQTQLGDTLINASYDSLHSFASLPQKTFDDPRVVIVYLDFASFLREHQDPAQRWPRELHAKLLRRLTTDGARAVVFDFIFDSPGAKPEADAAFADTIRENGRVILAAGHDNKISHETSVEVVWTRMTQPSLPRAIFANAAAGWGVASLWVNDDFVVRRHLPDFEAASSLSAAAARLLGLGVTNATTSGDAQLWVRYYGPALTIPHVSYSEALDPVGLPENFFRDKIVFVGARPIEGLIDERRDEFRSPFHSWRHKEFFMPGVEVHATQMLNLARGDWLQRLSVANENLLLLAIALAFGGGLVWLRPMPATIIAFAGAGLTLAISAGAFSRGIWFPWLIVSAAQIPAALAGSVLYNSLEWYRARRRFEAAKKIADAKIREQAALIDKAHDSILVQDLDGKFLYANPSAERLYGWNSAELQRNGASEEMFSPDAETAKAAHVTVLKSGEWNGELRQQTKDGRVVTVASRWTLIRDDAGQPRELLLINSDVTETKILEAQFLRTQRMNTIGTLAGGMAHDLNNALAPILMGVQLLRRKTTDEESKNLLGWMETNTHRGADMVRQVLLFARGRDGEFERLELAPIVKELEKMVRETFPKNIAVETFLPPDLWHVRGNPTQLHQVLLNLCVNARDAMPNGGRLSFAADNVPLNDAEAAEIPEAKPGEYVSLLVSDTGMGMPPEVRAKIFEPFFTTKGEGLGTGIGLATVMRIVKSHAGFLRVESEPGQGTTFEVFLPRALEVAQAAAIESQTEAPRGHGELILVVDDERAICELVSDGLTAHGYRVLTAANGEEGRRLFQKHHGEIRLVVTDSAMPVMDGAQTIAALRKERADLPVILASADADSESETAKIATAFLRKPFSLDELLAVVHRCTK
jgi:two-component system, cell cycle sensor histidine kinase and response regulator CckA